MFSIWEMLTRRLDKEVDFHPLGIHLYPLFQKVPLSTIISITIGATVWFHHAKCAHNEFTQFLEKYLRMHSLQRNFSHRSTAVSSSLVRSVFFSFHAVSFSFPANCSYLCHLPPFNKWNGLRSTLNSYQQFCEKYLFLILIGRCCNRFHFPLPSTLHALK